MKTRNKTLFCGDNQDADKLLCMLESNSVLSESFTSKIVGIIGMILTNLSGNEEEVEDMITRLESEMEWLDIFSEKFTKALIERLHMVYEKQKILQDKL